MRLEVWRSRVLLGTAALPAPVLASLRSGFYSGSGCRNGPQEWVEKGAPQVVELSLVTDLSPQLSTPRGTTSHSSGSSSSGVNEPITVRMELSLGVASAMVAVGKSHQGPFHNKRAIRNNDGATPQANGHANGGDSNAYEGREGFSDNDSRFGDDGDGDGDSVMGPELTFAESPRVGVDDNTSRASRFARTVAALAGGGRDRRANKTALSIKVCSEMKGKTCCNCASDYFFLAFLIYALPIRRHSP